MARVLRLGTRGSLLATAQSRVVADALKAAHPSLTVRLVPIPTRGDRDLRTSLRTVADPGFFSADLDEALLRGDVDCCVHSLKDLPVERHQGIRRAALPRRDDPRDVIVWRGDVPARLAAGAPLRVGTSSRRRQGNVADFLAFGLPAAGHPQVLEFGDLRGAVDARLGLLHKPRSDADAMDGVVLALAGLSRLWNDGSARPRLAVLLAGMRWMVLPLTKCPAAGGQGILAVECRTDDAPALDLLRSLHDPETAELAALEASVLKEFPADDQPAVGATAVLHATLGPLCHVRGATTDALVERIVWDRPPRPTSAIPFDGIAWQRACTRVPAPPLPELAALPSGAAVFVAYWHALQSHAVPADARLWVSGVESWRRLAAQGFWVEGCGDNLGFDALRATLETPVLQLPPLAEWTALTYGWAVPGWQASGIHRVLATYEILPPADGAVLDALKADAARATHFYWSSPEQFHALRTALPSGAHHACGAGKTLFALRAAAVDAQPFPNGREWQQWLH